MMARRAHPQRFITIISVMAAATLAACVTQKHEAGAKAHAAHRDPAHDKHSDHAEHTADEEKGAHEEKEAHEEHDHHGHAEGSDLDQSVAELFAASCEHDIKTHQCNECRYEVGVVKAPARLFEGGLLKTGKPEQRKIAVPLHLTGEVKFDERRVAHVSTLAEGIIKKVHVTLGDNVEPGQPMLELESVTIGEAQADHLTAQGMLKLAQRNHKRIAALRKEHISSQKEVLIAQQALDMAQIRAEAAHGKLTRLGMTSKAARSLTQQNAKGRLILRAPAAGTVLAMHAVAGEVGRSETSLVTVGDNSALWVWADLYERDVAAVTEAQARQPLAAEVEVKAFPGTSFVGMVDFVSPSMSESSRTVKLRIAVPNPSGRLLAGMFAGVKVFLPGPDAGTTLSVPRKAVLEDDGRSFLFVRHEADYYVRRPVVVGRHLGGWVEITEGLKGDESIVAHGAFLMKSDVLRSKMGVGCAD